MTQNVPGRHLLTSTVSEPTDPRFRGEISIKFSPNHMVKARGASMFNLQQRCTVIGSCFSEGRM